MEVEEKMQDLDLTHTQGSTSLTVDSTDLEDIIDKKSILWLEGILLMTIILSLTSRIVII